MFTLFVVLVFFVLVIPLGISAQRWLFQQEGEGLDPEWELYQQRFDEYTFVLPGRTERSPG